LTKLFRVARLVILAPKDVCAEAVNRHRDERSPWPIRRAWRGAATSGALSRAGVQTRVTARDVTGATRLAAA